MSLISAAIAAFNVFEVLDSVASATLANVNLLSLKASAPEPVTSVSNFFIPKNFEKDLINGLISDDAFELSASSVIFSVLGTFSNLTPQNSLGSVSYKAPGAPVAPPKATEPFVHLKRRGNGGNIAFSAIEFPDPN